MRLLLTNDDGVFAPGLITLASALAGAGHEISVVAPDRERSSVGHAITLTRPLRLWPVTSGAYPETSSAFACDGTPSDCVLLAHEEVLPNPDMVVSGINRGPNLGDDLTYSGTVSAAMEGIILGSSSMAVSLNCSESDPEHFYKTAAAVAVSLLSFLENFPLSRGVLLNVNVPNLPLDEVKGIRVTRKGTRVYEGKVTRMKDPSGRSYFWISGKAEDDLVEGSDVWAVARGYVSVTPVHMDMTHFPSLGALETNGAAEINFK